MLKFKLLFALGGPHLHLPFKGLIFLLLLRQLGLQLFHHFFLDHSSEAVAHSITRGFESCESGRRLCRVFFKLTLQLRLEENLNEALLGAQGLDEGWVDLLLIRLLLDFRFVRRVIIALLCLCRLLHDRLELFGF